MSYHALKQVMDDLYVSADDIQAILSTYAEILREESPFALSEIEAAEHIGLNIADMLEGLS